MLVFDTFLGVRRAIKKVFDRSQLTQLRQTQTLKMNFFTHFMTPFHEGNEYNVNVYKVPVKAVGIFFNLCWENLEMFLAKILAF